MIGIERFAPMNHIFRFYELEDYLRTSAELGYKAVDLWTCGAHYFVDANTYEDTGKIKALLRQYGLRAASMTPEQSCPKPFHMAVKKPELRVKAEQYFQHMIQAAYELECPKVLITSGWQGYSETREEAWKRSEEMVGKLCHFAEEYGVYLTMETLSRKSTWLVNTLEDLEQMRRAVHSPMFTVTADIHTIHNAGELLQDYFDTFGEALNHCHFMDYKDGVFSHLAWGDGDADMSSILGVFERNGYEGDFVLEFTDSRYYQKPEKAYRQTMYVIQENLRKTEV